MNHVRASHYRPQNSLLKKDVCVVLSNGSFNSFAGLAVCTVVWGLSNLENEAALLSLRI